MERQHQESNKQRVFDCYCKTVLRNEIRNYYHEVKRLRNKETPFSELPEQELNQISSTSEYFEAEQTFNVLGQHVVVSDENIVEALRNLPEQKRNIILLYYFLELSDAEIGEKLNLIRSTVQYQRSKTLRELKGIMEKFTHE